MYEISMMNMLIVGGATCHQSANIYYLCTNLLFWVSCVSVIWTLALVQCVCIVVFWCCLVPPTPPMLRPSLVCAVCLCVLQVRAASTVTSWSNQTPTALPNVPPPLQVGSAPDQQVYWPPTHTFADVYRCSCTQTALIITNDKTVFLLIGSILDIPNSMWLLWFVCGIALLHSYPTSC